MFTRPIESAPKEWVVLDGWHDGDDAPGAVPAMFLPGLAEPFSQMVFFAQCELAPLENASVTLKLLGLNGE